MKFLFTLLLLVAITISSPIPSTLEKRIIGLGKAVKAVTKTPTNTSPVTPNVRGRSSQTSGPSKKGSRKAGGRSSQPTPNTGFSGPPKGSPKAGGRSSQPTPNTDSPNPPRLDDTPTTANRLNQDAPTTRGTPKQFDDGEFPRSVGYNFWGSF